jgi:hypothetical protein
MAGNEKKYGKGCRPVAELRFVEGLHIEDHNMGPLLDLQIQNPEHGFKMGLHLLQVHSKVLQFPLKNSPREKEFPIKKKVL